MLAGPDLYPSFRMTRFASTLAFTVAFGFGVNAFADRIRYEVAPGDSLGRIAANYDVSVEDLRRWNDIDGDMIVVGDVLTIRISGGGSSRTREEYTVRSGDTGGAIARRHGVSLSELERWNPSVNIDRLRIGQELTIYVDGGESESGGYGSGARGTPQSGRLRGGVQLQETVGVRVRDADRAYGTLGAIQAIQNGYARLAAHFIDMPSIEVGDISYERGGDIGTHRSHQNGLDADISYYRHECPENNCEWREVEADEIDVELQWYLFQTWIDQGVVEYLFVDYELQPVLYDYAVARGATEEQLEAWFQYPRSRGSSRGIIRHEPGHDDHFHVRFYEMEIE